MIAELDFNNALAASAIRKFRCVAPPGDIHTLLYNGPPSRRKGNIYTSCSVRSINLT